jgi:hypothetical protein
VNSPGRDDTQVVVSHLGSSPMIGTFVTSSAILPYLSRSDLRAKFVGNINHVNFYVGMFQRVCVPGASNKGRCRLFVSQAEHQSVVAEKISGVLQFEGIAEDLVPLRGLRRALMRPDLDEHGGIMAKSIDLKMSARRQGEAVRCEVGPEHFAKFSKSNSFSSTLNA